MNILKKASFQCLVILLSVTITFFILFFGSYGNDDFSIAGGVLGGISSIIVIVNIYVNRDSSSSSTLSFWRALCDLGLAIRFMAIPGFNLWICSHRQCTRSTGDSHACPLPSFLFQFFLIGSESWVCCTALDLYWSITNPFLTFQSRISTYYLVALGLTLLLSATPFLFNVYNNVYGFWFISDYHDDSAICWLRVEREDQVGTTFYIYAIIPLALYLFGLFAVFIAYIRLFKLTNSFIPQLPSLAANTLNIFIVSGYWSILMCLYFIVRYTENYNTPFPEDIFNILCFWFGAKGLTTLFTWVFCANPSTITLTEEENKMIQDGFKSLKQEILTFATAGIRNTANYKEITSETDILIGKVIETNTAIVDRSFLTPRFFLKFMFGGKKEMKIVREALSNSSRIKIPERLISVQKPTSSASLSRSSFPLRSKSSAAAADITADINLPHSEFRYSIQSNRESVESSHLSNLFLESLKVMKNWFDLKQSDVIEFAEYQPFHFRRVRLAFGILEEDYTDAFSATIKERVSEGGASGAFFFFSKGERFLAKSCTREEVQTLRENAKSYADYMTTNPLTYICKIYGVYELKIYGNNLFFLVMNNVFYNRLNLSIHEKYDLKGSWVGRNAKPPIEGKRVNCSRCGQKFVYSRNRKRHHQSLSQLSSLRIGGKLYNVRPNPIPSPIHDSDTTEISLSQSQMNEQSVCPFTVNGNHEPNIILKDNDIKYKIRFTVKDTVQFLSQIRADCEFLYSLGIMDYSLLIGIHNTEYEIASTTTLSTSGSSSSLSNPPPSDEPIFTNEIKVLLNRKTLKSFEGNISDGVQMSASSLSFSSGERITKAHRVIGPDCYFMGIIDFQQRWNFQKKMERFLKIHFGGADRYGLSAIEPTEYKERFLRKMEDILDIEIPDEQ